MKIRLRLALFFAGVGVLAVAFTSAVNYAMAEAALKVTVANQLVGLRSSKARHIETALRDVRRTVEVKASDIATRRAFERLCEAYDRSNRDKLRIAYSARGLDGDASQIFDPGDGSPYTTVHREVHLGLHDFRLSMGVADVFLCDPKRGVILYTDRKGDDFARPLSDPQIASSGLAEAVGRSLRTNRSVISDLRPYAPSHGFPASFITAPIREGGNVVGVLAVQIGLAQIDEMVTPGSAAREGLGETGEALIVGPDLALRNDSHSVTQMQSLQEDLKRQGISADRLQAIERSKSTVLTVRMPDVYGAALQADGYMEATNYRGRKVVAAFEPLNIPGLRWAIIVEQDQAEAYEPLVSLRSTSLLAGAAMLLVTFLLAYLASNSFTRPLDKLSEAAQRFGQGIRGVRVGLTGKDEFGALGQTFDQMVAQQEHFDDAATAIRRNIVHDLKTPLAVIKGMAETLEHGDVRQDEKLSGELVETIVHESDRLLDDLQDILQPVTASYQPQRERFDLSRLVMITGNLERHTSRAERHKIVVTGADAPVWVSADRRKVRRVLENLVGNAVKYSPGDGKEVTLSLTQTENEVRVTISDQGLGMTAEQLARVLSEGGRVAEHAQIGIEGTGFGLSSVRQILEAHGGKLIASSEVGVGSTFTVVLPRQNG